MSGRGLPHPVHFLMGVEGGLVPPTVNVTLSDLMIRDVDVDSVLAQYPDLNLANTSIAARISTGSSYGKHVMWQSVAVPWPRPEGDYSVVASTIVNIDLSAGVTAVSRQALRSENRLRAALHQRHQQVEDDVLDAPNVDDEEGRPRTTVGMLQAYSDGVEMLNECMDRADASGARVSFTIPIAELAEQALRTSGAECLADTLHWWSHACTFSCDFLLTATTFADPMPLMSLSFSVAPAVCTLYEDMLYGLDDGLTLESIIAIETETSPLAVYLGGHSPNTVNRRRRVVADGDDVERLLRAGADMVVEVPVEMRVRRRASRCASIVTCAAFIGFPAAPSDAAMEKQIHLSLNPRSLRSRRTPRHAQRLQALQHVQDDSDDDDVTGDDGEHQGLTLPMQAKLEHALNAATEEATRLFAKAMIPIEHRLDALSRRLTYLEGFAATAVGAARFDSTTRRAPRVIKALPRQ